MKGKRWEARRLGLVAMVLALGCESRGPIAAPSTSQADELSAHRRGPPHAAGIRWDIVTISAVGIAAGGSASATAADGLKIILTGSGTFVAPEVDDRGRDDGKRPHHDGARALGGGTWETRNASDAATGSGTYRVTGVVSWDRALASLPAGAADLIADPATSTAGLAILQVAYSDGSRGTLTISCRITGTEPGRFEGVTASKGFVDFWSPVTSPTLFHVVD